jgi:cell division protein FtsI (penicillin-binding protein 3)
MDNRTGEILGSASLPDFDPNNFQDSTDQERMNRPAVWAYEPGSVFKIFSLSALMETQAINSTTLFICDGHYEQTTNLGERVVINCLSAHGSVNARDIIIYSCNAGAAYASDTMGNAGFYTMLRNFGFGARTVMGSPGETAGILPVAERWSARSKPTISMGQEIGVSAMQMLQAATAIANDGVMVSPHVVSRIVSADGTTERPYEIPPARRVISAQTAQEMRSYMEAVTSNIGTGWRANVADLSLAVKTGTAQLIDPETLAYSDTDFIASCIALLPADEPVLVLYMVIIKPQGAEYLGGRIATTPIREAAEALVDYLGIPRGRNPQTTHSPSILLSGQAVPELVDTVPDYTGFSKHQLLSLILREDLMVELSGEGWVAHQSPAPGTPYTPNMTITLEFE